MEVTFYLFKVLSPKVVLGTVGELEKGESFYGFMTLYTRALIDNGILTLVDTSGNPITADVPTYEGDALEMVELGICQIPCKA